VIEVKATGMLDGLRILEAGIVQAAANALKGAMAAAEASEKSSTLFHDRTGATRASIRARRVGHLAGVVEVGGAAKFLESGTRAHIINAPVQVRPGIWRFIRRHPGTVARPFVSQARERAEAAATYAAEFYVQEAIHRAR